MKIIHFILTFLLFSLCSLCNAINFTTKSVLSEGKWEKIRVSETGVCKLTFAELKEMGFSDPSKVRVYGYGGVQLYENITKNTIDDLNELASYQGNDFILFYARGPLNWCYNTRFNCAFVPSMNNYSNYGYYFLTDSGEGSANRIETEKSESSEYTNQVRDFIHRDCILKEDFNFISSGRVWYGDKMNQGETKNYTLNFPNIVKTKEINSTFFVATSSSKSISVTGSCFNEYDSKSTTSVKGYEKAHEIFFQTKGFPLSDDIPLSVYSTCDDVSSYVGLRYISVNAYRNLIMDGGYMNFRNIDYLDVDDYSQFIIKNVNSNTMVWEVTDVANIKNIPLKFSGDSATFIKKINTLREFVAINPDSDDFIKAEHVGSVENQNLHSMQNVDFLIITHPDFLEDAERLAEKHRSLDGVNVAVVTAEQVYNEFSSGTPDATAYRLLMRMVYDRANGKNVYLLLFGDGCYDNKGILATKQNTINNFLLTYQSYTSVNETLSYVSDDYFGMMHDEDCGEVPISKSSLDVGIGRLPVSTKQEAKDIVDKIISYLDNNYYGTWKNRMLFLADDNETNSSKFSQFCKFAENLSSMILRSNPAMDIKKIYFDAYTRETGSNGNRYPEVESSLLEEINNGVMYLNYIGHSGTTGFSAERVFTQSQAKDLYNKKLGLWFTASCQFSQFDDLVKSGGEDLVLNPNGGAIAICSSARTVYDNLNDELNQAFVDALTKRDEMGRPLYFGDIHKIAKQTLSETGKADSNKLCYFLFGDPMIRISYPELIVRTDSIQTLDGTPIDTFKALSCVRVFVSVVDDAENKISAFNGKLFITIYDKEETLTTKANPATTDEQKESYMFSYVDRPTVLYSGSAEVINGEAVFVFKMPKDINYSVGTGRISYYAYDEPNNFEAQGVHQSFYVGGSESITTDDNEGPNIELYLNSKSFSNGAVVNTSPVLFADIADENGINASGNGIGHDITLSLNGSSDVKTLNSYFTYESGSYDKGQIEYQLQNLDPGKYTLTFKVWDLLNNSSTKEITFNVVEGTSVGIDNMSLQPNPAKENVTISVEHNRPQTQITYQLFVYDMFGKIVYSTDKKTEINDGILDINWDLKSNTGIRVPYGSYACKVILSSDNGEEKENSQILIVMPQ